LALNFRTERGKFRTERAKSVFRSGLASWTRSVSSAISRTGPPGYLLFLLLATDLMFVLVHAIRANTTLIASNMYALNRERGYAEAFQYIKFYWIVLAMSVLFWRTRAAVYAGWMALFAYLLLDDALQIHEEGGRVVAERMGYRELLGLRAVDFGELTFVAVVSVLLLGLIAIGYWRSGPDARTASKGMVVLVAALGLCGVVFDVLHQLARRTRFADWFTIAEDGGEMVVVSVICAYAGGLCARAARV
jgi:hypothetical protein